MPDMMTVSTKGQITIPIEIRTSFGLKPGDKIFGEETAEGYCIRRPKKNLLDYKGFVKVKSDPEAEREEAMRGVATHVMGEDEC